MKQTCKDCKYWSKMIAKSEDGIIKAMCLDLEKEVSAFTPEHHTCDNFAQGEPIDKPGVSKRGGW